MKNQTLSIEQMQRLRELGVDTSKASMCMTFTRLVRCEDIDNVYCDDVIFDKDGKPYIQLPNGIEYLNEHFIDGSEMKGCKHMEMFGTFTLQDILEIISTITYKSFGFPIIFFDYNIHFKHWNVALRNPDTEIKFPDIKEKSPLDAAYKAIVWFAENGYLKGGKK